MLMKAGREGYKGRGDIQDYTLEARGEGDKGRGDTQDYTLKVIDGDTRNE